MWEEVDAGFMGETDAGYMEVGGFLFYDEAEAGCVGVGGCWIFGGDGC